MSSALRADRLIALCLAVACVTTAMAVESSKAVCKHTTDCEGENYECIDSRCVCNPLWGHAGYDCTERRWGSWALVVVLVFTSVLSVAVLASAASSLSDQPSKHCAGLVELAKMLCQRQKESDSGSTTVRVVLVSAVVDLISYLWKMLTAVGVVSDATSAYWNARLIFPVAEGCMVLPCALVVSVWMDVANSSMSRSKMGCQYVRNLACSDRIKSAVNKLFIFDTSLSKKKLERTKRFLQLGTAVYIILLLLMCMFDNIDLAMVVQLGAIGLGMTACGSGAAKLCNTLRAMGKSSAGIADTVFQVSRSMGVSLYGIFIGNTMLLSSRTRQSDPANLALFGFLVSSLGKCFLHKAIFKYMVANTRAKKARLIASANMNKGALLRSMRPVVRLVSSIREMKNSVRLSRVAVDGQQGNSDRAISETTTNDASPASQQEKLELVTEWPGENNAVADDAYAEEKVQEETLMEQSLATFRTEGLD